MQRKCIQHVRKEVLCNLYLSKGWKSTIWWNLAPFWDYCSHTHLLIEYNIFIWIGLIQDWWCKMMHMMSTLTYCAASNLLSSEQDSLRSSPWSSCTLLKMQVITWSKGWGYHVTLPYLASSCNVINNINLNDTFSQVTQPYLRYNT